MTNRDNSPDDFIRAMDERKNDPSKRSIHLPEDLASRTLGIFLLITASILFLMGTYLPISDAQSQASSIIFKPKWLYLQPILFIFGLIYTVFGENSSKIIGPTSKPSAYGWIIVVVSIAAGFWYVHLAKSYLISLGYQV